MTNDYSKKAIIISAPSGAGKTTIVHHLLKVFPQLEFSVSATSREKRTHETEGKDYFFIGIEEFKKKIVNNELLEWEEVYPNLFYGTLKSEIANIWKCGHIATFDVDVVGGLNLKKKFRDNALALFIMPPHFDELEKRLRNRGTESPEKLATRIAKAKTEMEKARLFDKIIVNDSLPHAFADAEQLVREFLKNERP